MLSWVVICFWVTKSDDEMVQSSFLKKGEKFVDAQLPAMMFYMCVFDMVKDVSSLSNLTYSQNVYVLIHQLLQSAPTWKELAHQQQFTNQSPKKGSFCLKLWMFF